MRNTSSPSTCKDFSEYFKGRQKEFFSSKGGQEQAGWTPFESSCVVDEKEDFMEDKVC